MSVRYSNHNVVLDDDVLLPSVICILSRTLSAEVEDNTVIPYNKKGNDIPATTSVKTLSTSLEKGLIRKKSCKTSVEIAEMIVAMISKQFTMTAEVATEFLV